MINVPSYISRIEGEVVRPLMTLTVAGRQRDVHGFRDRDGYTVIGHRNNSEVCVYYTNRGEHWYAYDGSGVRHQVASHATLPSVDELWAFHQILVKQREIELGIRDRNAAREQVAAEQKKMEDLINEAHAYADGKSWCGEFDEICRHLGIPPRIQNFEVTVPVTVEVKLELPGHRNGESALEAITDEMLVEGVYNLTRASIRDGLEYMLDDVEPEVVD